MSIKNIEITTINYTIDFKKNINSIFREHNLGIPYYDLYFDNDLWYCRIYTIKNNQYIYFTSHSDIDKDIASNRAMNKLENMLQ